MTHVIQRVQHDLRERRERYQRLVVLQNATTPSHRHELEVIFQRAADNRAE